MAKTEPRTLEVPVPPSMTMEQFAALMAQFSAQITTGITAGIAESRPRKITAGQYDPKTPFHPNKRTAKKLTRACYQNGTRLSAAQMFNEEIDLLNRINRSGRYINRLIEVIVRQEGADEVVELRYKNRTIDDRMMHKGAYRDLRDMLTQIVTEQDKLNAEDGVRKEARRASFSSAATREARARAEALEAAEEAELEP